MPKKKSLPPQSLASRTGSLFRLAGSLAQQELVKKIKSAGNELSESVVRIKQAQLLVKELGHLKGAAMKLGQMLALEARDYLPEEACIILDQLQASAEPMDFEEVQKILNEDLGEKVKDLVFDGKAPIASASIGQVHKVTLFGKEVAVKIQYPGIRQSIVSDVKGVQSLFQGLKWISRKKVDFSGIVYEFQDIFLQESDYRQEANFLKKYSNFAQNIPHLKIPQVYSDYSTERVLCMSYETGLSLHPWLKSHRPSEELRYDFARKILDLYTREFCDWGLVQTDPNLGNFLFRPEDQSIVLLDFGATKEYSLSFRQQYASLIVATYEDQIDSIGKIGIEMGLIDPRESPAAFENFTTLLLESMKPMKYKIYDFSDNEYPQKMREISRRLALSLKYSPPPRNLIFLHRKLSGVFNMLRALKVKLSLETYVKRFKTLALESPTKI